MEFKMLKRVFSFVRSMKFGLILLIIVAGYSVVGSLIPQTFEPAWYIINYPTMGEFIVMFNLHRIFGTVSFVVVCALLGLSLMFAIVFRLIQVRKILKNMYVVPEEGYRPKELTPEDLERMNNYFAKKRYKQLHLRDATVYHKNKLGFYGSTLVHLSIFLTLIFGGAIFAFTEVEDVLILPGQTQVLADGSRMTLHHFRMYDVDDRREYASIIDVVAPDGRSSGYREISVNHPLRFNNFRYYQFSYLYAGSITVTDMTTGGHDTFFVTERSFLSADDRTGIWFETVFQGWTEDEETGRIIPLVFNAPIFPNPIYYIMLITDYSQEAKFALPGTHVRSGNLLFEFNDLINYPGIRVSTALHPLPGLLYSSFGLMMIGLFLSFYLYPAIVTVRGNKYRIVALKSSGTYREIEEAIIGKIQIYESDSEAEEVVEAVKIDQLDETDEVKKE
jgi:cytochrome c biogenesis protein